MKNYLRKHAWALVLAGVCIGTLEPVSAGQNVYRWIDEAGNTVVSDRPPPEGVKYEVVSLQGNLMNQVDNPIPAPSAGQEGGDSDPSASQSRQPGIPKNPEYCSQAQQNLSNLNTFARIRIQGADGEYRYLTEEEKDDQRRQAEDAIDAYCE